VFMERMQTTTTSPSGAESSRKEGLMTSTTSETQCRDFAREFPTPNALRAIVLCEAGTLRWEQVEAIFRASLAKGLEAVK
jgi:hypothetical protein